MLRPYVMLLVLQSYESPYQHLQHWSLPPPLLPTFSAPLPSSPLPLTPPVVQGASWLLSVPGASATVLEVAVPYSRGSLVDLMGEVS